MKMTVLACAIVATLCGCAAAPAQKLEWGKVEQSLFDDVGAHAGAAGPGAAPHG